MSDATAAPNLVGALSGFALADALQLIELGARSGSLVVDGGPRGRGRVVIRTGQIVEVTCAAADAPSGDLVDRLAMLLALPAGHWAFHPASADVAGAEPSGLRIADALLRASCRHDEQAADRGERSTAASAARHAPISARATPPLTGADLAVLAAADDRRGIAAIAAAVRQDRLTVRASLDRLRSLGLVATDVSE